MTFNKKYYIAAIVLVFALILLSPLLLSHNLQHKTAVGISMLPWQIEQTDNDNIRVFGIIPQHTTLQQAISQFGQQSGDLAVMAPSGKQALLEMYFESFQAGFISGKMVLTLAAPEDLINTLKTAASETTHTPGLYDKYSISRENSSAVMNLPIQVITFIPSARLDENTITQRFGEAQEILSLPENQTAFLYPEKGLGILRSARQPTVLQYIAPGEFHRISDPLHSLQNTGEQPPPEE